MEKIQKRTQKYEISLSFKKNGYFMARISTKIGLLNNRLEASGTSEESAILNLLDKLNSQIDLSYKNGLIVCKFDERIPQKLFNSIATLNLSSAEITEKVLIIVNKINNINAQILSPLSTPWQTQTLQIPNTSLNIVPISTQTISTNTFQTNNNMINPTKKYLLKDLINEWLDYRMSLCKKTNINTKQLSQTTIDNNYIRLRDDIIPYFQKHKLLYLSQLNETNITNLLNGIKCQNSKHKAYLILNMLFKYAIKKRITQENIMEFVDKPPEKITLGKTRTDDNYIEPSEIGKWIDILKKENTNMSILFATMILTGIRPEEACGLKWSAIDFDNNTISINNAYKSFNDYDEKNNLVGHYHCDSKLKTSTSYRTIPLVPVLKEILLKHNKEQQETFKLSRAIKDKHKKWSKSEYVFLGRNYTPYIPASLAYGLRKIRLKYNLTSTNDYVTPYGLRRTFATYWSSKGMQSIILKNILGHSDIQTTVQHYIKVSSHQMLAEMNKVENTN